MKCSQRYCWDPRSAGTSVGVPCTHGSATHGVITGRPWLPHRYTKTSHRRFQLTCRYRRCRGICPVICPSRDTGPSKSFPQDQYPWSVRLKVQLRLLGNCSCVPKGAYSWCSTSCIRSIVRVLRPRHTVHGPGQPLEAKCPGVQSGYQIPDRFCLYGGVGQPFLADNKKPT